MKVCHVFLDFDIRIEVYAEIYKKLVDICGIHGTIYSHWILSGEDVEYTFQVWDGDISDVSWLDPQVTTYFYGNKWAYPDKTRQFLDKFDKNKIIWVES